MKKPGERESLLELVGAFVASRVERGLDPLKERLAAAEAALAALRAEAAEAGEGIQLIGQDGAPGERGEKGEPGAPGPAGRDGVGLAGGFIDREGKLILTLSDGTAQALGEIVGRDGAPGKDGRDGQDGLGFDSLDVGHDGERGIHFRFARGEQVKEWRFTVPAILDRGVFSEEKEYARGDGVSYGGSFFIAQTDAPAGRPESSKDWRLAIKRGRDGRDGKPAKTAAAEAPVRGFPAEKGKGAS